MADITVWTKQDRRILDVLEQQGRYIVRREYITQKMDTVSPLYLDVYNWYAGSAAAIVPKPPDVRYPVWVTLEPDSTLANDDGTVVLELRVEEALVVRVDYLKWGYVVNYQYIPESPADEAAHGELLARYGVDNAAAYQSAHYPMLKQKIRKSWERMFLPTEAATDDVAVGTLWEVRAEWMRTVT